MLRADPIFLETYLRDAENLSEDEFLGRFDHPFAVIPGIEISSLNELYRSVGREQPSEVVREPKAGKDGEDNSVILCLGLRPKHGVSFDRMTVGRTADADIVILDDTVSKIHAEMSWDAYRERCVITDLGSRNGTTVAGQVVNSGANARVSSGMIISLGNIQARFFVPRAFLSWLKNRLGSSIDTNWLVGMGSEDSTYNSSRRL